MGKRPVSPENIIQISVKTYLRTLPIGTILGQYSIKQRQLLLSRRVQEVGRQVLLHGAVQCGRILQLLKILIALRFMVHIRRPQQSGHGHALPPRHFVLPRRPPRRLAIVATRWLQPLPAAEHHLPWRRSWLLHLHQTTATQHLTSTPQLSPSHPILEHNPSLPLHRHATIETLTPGTRRFCVKNKTANLKSSKNNPTSCGKCNEKLL